MENLQGKLESLDKMNMADWPDEAYDWIAAGLSDTSSDTRYLACRAAGQSSVESFVDPLKHLQKTKDEDIASMAKYALEEREAFMIDRPGIDDLDDDSEWNKW